MDCHDVFGSFLASNDFVLLGDNRGQIRFYNDNGSTASEVNEVGAVVMVVNSRVVMEEVAVILREMSVVVSIEKPVELVVWVIVKCGVVVVPVRPVMRCQEVLSFC
jgi:hypothetical protein